MHDDRLQPDMNSQEPDWDALSRFIAGESDPVEFAQMEAWLAAHPEDGMLVDVVKAHSERSEASAAVPVNVEAALASVRQRAFGETEGRPELSVVRGGASARSAAPKVAPASRGSNRYWYAAAAAVVAVVGVQAWRGAHVSGVARTVATAVGQRDSMTLSDGTKVMLAPGSSLTVAAGFDSGDRVVTLMGAAFFDVKHDAAHPFTVRASDAEIRDIGTAFAVNTDQRGGVSVAVTHGVVALRQSSASAPAPVELHAGDRGVLSSGAVAVTRGTVTADDISWTRGQLSYHDTPLSEVQADLKRWYGINLQVADSALQKLTVSVMHAPSEAALLIKVVAGSIGADVEQRGDTVIFHSAGHSTTP